MHLISTTTNGPAPSASSSSRTPLSLARCVARGKHSSATPAPKPTKQPSNLPGRSATASTHLGLSTSLFHSTIPSTAAPTALCPPPQTPNTKPRSGPWYPASNTANITTSPKSRLSSTRKPAV
ncbi:hypothetical protein EMPG_17159 [Blastomyces silverae]|uniref:Uncharacterized protein n=1 Tax=Blastomyces silverae TaxID=2060906 RepID=A0A0H1BDW2_9EURO|nr:hypothetical protein EMPG_17159 [Blastomyces silverae]